MLGSTSDRGKQDVKTSCSEPDYNLRGRPEEVVVTQFTGGVVSSIQTDRYTYVNSGIRVSVEHEVDSTADATTESVAYNVSLVDANNFTGYQQVIAETVNPF